MTVNPLALHALVVLRGTEENAWRNAVAATARAGFDMLEVPVRDPAAVPAMRLRTMLDDAGLGRVCLTALPPDADIAGGDPAAVGRGERHLNAVLDVAVTLGARYLGGVLYGTAGRHERAVPLAGRRACARALRRLADRASRHDITLGLEVVNRFETNFLTTAAAALEFADEIGAGNVGVHLDTFHMNIEESDPAGAVRSCGERLVYLHASESHRGRLGDGTVDFAAVFRAVAAMGYAGPVGFESFTASAAPRSLTASMGLWRDVWEDAPAVAAEAREFIARGLAEVRESVAPGGHTKG